MIKKIAAVAAGAALATSVVAAPQAVAGTKSKNSGSSITVLKTSSKSGHGHKGHGKKNVRKGKNNWWKKNTGKSNWNNKNKKRGYGKNTAKYSSVNSFLGSSKGHGHKGGFRR